MAVTIRSKFLCPKGSKKCSVNKRCVRKTSIKTPRCKKGSRKCANQRCYSKREFAAAKIQRLFLKRREEQERERVAEEPIPLTRTNNRCRVGTRRCIRGDCIKKSIRGYKTPRCRRGTRKCADQLCYNKKP